VTWKLRKKNGTVQTIKGDHAQEQRYSRFGTPGGWITAGTGTAFWNRGEVCA